MKVWLSPVAVMLFAAASCAQTPAPLKSVIGEITSIDAANKQIKLKADDGAAYTVTLSDNTSFLRIPPGETDLKKAAKIAFTDVMVGDRALARGPLDDQSKTVPARTALTMSAIRKRAERSMLRLM